MSDGLREEEKLLDRDSEQIQNGSETNREHIYTVQTAGRGRKRSQSKLYEQDHE